MPFAFVLNLEAIALDDALDLLDILITDIFSEAKNAGERARFRRIQDLDVAAIQLSKVCRLVLDPNVPDVALRETVFAAIAQEALAAAVDQVDHLVRPPEDIYYQELCDSFRRVRTFLPSLYAEQRTRRSRKGTSIASTANSPANNSPYAMIGSGSGPSSCAPASPRKSSGASCAICKRKSVPVVATSARSNSPTSSNSTASKTSTLPGSDSMPRAPQWIEALALSAMPLRRLLPIRKLCAKEALIALQRFREQLHGPPLP